MHWKSTVSVFYGTPGIGQHDCNKICTHEHYLLCANWNDVYIFHYLDSSPLSTRPHQNVVWYNNSWLGFLKHSVLCTKRKRKIYCKNWALICHSWMLQWLIGIILGEIIFESSNWQHIQRLKITILGANWQLFRLERIAKCSYFILSTQNIKFYWFVMKIKKFMLPIWWYNRGWFPLGNKYLGSSFWMG